MPISFGTSTTVIGLPLRSGALVGCAAVIRLGDGRRRRRVAGERVGRQIVAAGPGRIRQRLAGAAEAAPVRPKTSIIILQHRFSPYMFGAGWPARRPSPAPCVSASAVRRSRRSKLPTITVPIRTTPMTTIVPSPLTPDKESPLLQRLHQGEAEHRADDRTTTAEDRGAAEDDRGDDVELEPRPHIRAGGGDPRDENDPGEAGHHPCFWERRSGGKSHRCSSARDTTLPSGGRIHSYSPSTT